MFIGIAHIIVPLVREQGFIELIQYMGFMLGVIFLFLVLNH